MKTLNEQPQNRLVSNAIVFTAFLLTAQIGTYLYREIGTSPAMIWAPIGIAFAGVILAGASVWPGIALAALANSILNGTPPLIMAGAVLGNTIQPLVAFYFLKKADLNRKLARVKDMFLILGTSMFVTMIVPTINTVTINLYNQIYSTERPTFWANWWIGGALSALILTPFLIRWLRYPISKYIKSRLVEICTALMALCIISYFVFATPYSMVGGFSLVYPLLGVLLWIAFRTNSRIMSLALFLMTVISMAGALYGDYVPTASGLSGRVFSSQVFDLILAVIFFILVSIEEQRKHAIAIMRDKNKQLESALDKIRENDKNKNEFIAMMAHELRNPLAAFLSSAELLLADPVDAAETKSLALMMQGRVKTMSRLLDDLLDVSRISRGQMELKKEKVSFGRAVESAAQSVMPLIRQQGHSFQQTLPEQEIILDADPIRLEQILINLLTNAAKYTPPGGSIGLKANLQQDWLRINVSDNGIGIPADMLEKIFDPFVQLGKKINVASGIGVGLALTKSLVEMHGGNINVQSSDQGSEFTVKLPAAGQAAAESAESQQPRAREAAAQAAPGRQPQAKFDILVVDDNLDACRGLAKLLALRGHNTQMAHSGQGALERVAAAKPDVVLLDIGLPDMDGYEVARTLQQQGNAPMLIAITGYGQMEDRERARQAGFDHHLTKPVGLEDIEAVLNELD